MLKIIIAGGRDFKDAELLDEIMFNNLKDFDPEEIQIVSGMAGGADKLGYDWAKSYNLDVKEFPANWLDFNAKPCKLKRGSSGRLYNVLAGFNRNQQMADYADELVAFFDGESSGTKDMIKRAKFARLKLLVVNY